MFFHDARTLCKLQVKLICHYISAKNMFHLNRKAFIPTASGENPECYGPIPLIIG